ncbi:MAG: hypothetical protein NTY35_04010 [Planctomycetota bacterium]|nr:hypothetical protein [Planctomycetota bacterium]
MNPLARRGSLLVLLPVLAGTAHAQWPSNPATNLPVCDATGDQGVPKVAAGGDGSTWAAWFDNRGGSYAVYAQKLDAAGNEVFAHNGLLVSANPQNTSTVDWGIESDGAGGCVIAFTDIRVGPDLDTYVYRIDGAGTFLWGANGVALSNNADFESNPKVARLTDGSFAVTWSRGPNTGPGAIHVQKLDANGVPQFAGEGLQIVGSGTEKPAFSNIVASDAGGWIVGYVRDISSFASPRHFRAQKFDSAGNALWNGGAPLAVYDAAAVPIGYQPIVQSDGAGGGVFAWHSAIGSTFDCWIQRVTSAGAEVHAHNGVQVSTEASRNKYDPSIAIVAGGDVVVAFNKRNGAQSQWATCVQRIDGAGARLWSNDGVELLPLNGIPKQFERCVPLGNDAVVLTCEQTNYPAQGLRVLGFRVNGAGANVWAGSPVVVSSVLSAKDKIPVTTDVSGIVRAVWDDARNDSGDIYAQNVNTDGTLGPAPSVATGFCFGDGTGAACPCANTGLTGRGCANSVDPGGALLVAAGVPLLSADSVLLSGSGMPNSTVLYFQGTTQQSGGAGVAFGDGKRCAGGSVVRLGTKVNSAGASSYPAAGDPSVSVRGLVTVPGTRTYQAWYRNAAAFCTASTFNLSNGVEFPWGA